MTASTPMRCGRWSRSAFCTVRDLATKRLPQTIPSLLVSTVTAALVTVCGAFLVGPMGGWSPVSLETLGLLATAAVLLLVGYQCHHHGHAHRRNLLSSRRSATRRCCGRSCSATWFSATCPTADDRRRADRRRLRALHALSRARRRARHSRQPPARRRPWRRTGSRCRPQLNQHCRRPSCWPAAGRRAWAAATRACELLGGRPLLAHVLDRLAPQASAVAISANGDPGALRAIRPAGAGRYGSQAISARWPACSPACNGRKASAQRICCQHADRHAVLSRGSRRRAGRSRDSAGRAGACRFGRPAASGRRRCGRSRSPAGSRDFLRVGHDLQGLGLRRRLRCGRRRVPDDRACAAAASIRSSTSTRPADLAQAETLLEEIAAMTRVFGITGWKNSGKTTLTEKLVAEFTRRG